MTSFLDRPSSHWLGTQIRLPTIELSPQDDSTWLVQVMVFANGSGSYALRECSQAELSLLLADWRDNPEGALAIWFGRQAPSQGQAGLSTITKLEEIF